MYTIIYTRLKPYSCEVCLKKFSMTSSLNIHTRIYTGISIKFVQKSLFINVLQRLIWESIEGKNRTVVKFARKIFPRNDKLMNRVRTFSQNSNLTKYNMKIQAGESSVPFMYIWRYCLKTCPATKMTHSYLYITLI